MKKKKKPPKKLKKKHTKRPRGRPSKISTIDLSLMERLYKQGLIDEQVAAVLAIDKKTLNTFKKKHPDFFHSLKKGKEVADDKVVASLFKRANGFDYTEATYESIKIGKVKSSAIKIKEVVKHVVPDTLACVYWLNNRRPDEWKQRQDISGTLKVPVTIVNKIPKHLNKE